MLRQQTALDLPDLNKYIGTFYPGTDTFPLRRTGNFAIAIRDKITAAEKRGAGLDLWPLISLWAMCYRVQASFGQYYFRGYDGAQDGEAKNFYRLFCRRVEEDCTLSSCNHAWMDVLAGGKLAAVYVQRDVSTSLDPYIHIIFKPEYKKMWMIGEFSPAPTAWLEEHGFAEMEHFDIEVGIVDDTSTTATAATAAAITTVKPEEYDLPTWCAVNSAAVFKF